jgi:hypothetical protein
MSTKTLFKIQAIIFLINGLGQLFVTKRYFELANITVNPGSYAIGQCLGVIELFLSIMTWKIADFEGNYLTKFAKIYTIGALMWMTAMGYHLATGIIEGPAAFINIALLIVFTILNFKASIE